MILFIFLKLGAPVLSQTDTPAPTTKFTPTPTGVNLLDKLEKIKILKEKVATKVNELRQSEKHAILGTVTDISDDTISIKSENGKDINIQTTEDTLYFSFDKSGKKSQSSVKKINKDTLISAFGFLEESDMEGKIIYIENPLPIHIVGKILDIDRKNFTLTMKNQSQEEWLIDIETYTRTSLFSKKDKITKAGFSKLLPSDLLHAIASENTKEKNRASALRIVKFSDFSPKEILSTTPIP